MFYFFKSKKKTKEISKLILNNFGLLISDCMPTAYCQLPTLFPPQNHKKHQISQS